MDFLTGKKKICQTEAQRERKRWENKIIGYNQHMDTEIFSCLIGVSEENGEN